MEAVDRILFNGKRLGYEHLKEEQFEVVTQYVQGRDCFFRAPTGYGKSVVFQLAPFVCASPTTKTVAIIIVPTIALAQDAVGKTNDLMAKHDIPLTAVHLTCASLSLAREASYIFTSPEAILDSHIGRQLLNSAEFCSEVKAIFVDEGHIVESWGYSEYGRAFRAQYGQLGVLRSFFPACPVIAITATAVSATRTFVIDSLGMRRIHDVSVDINKVNIKYNVVHCMTDEEENFDWLIEELKQHSSSTPRTLVFFTRANKLYSVYNHIKQHTDEPNPLLAMYHKLTDGNIRQDVISSLNESDSRLRVVLCTSSLSVGVNLSCVEYVVHYGVPVSVQDFLQETGRAAREPGSVGQSILMTYPRQTKPGTDQSLKDYSSSKCAECRRAIVLKPFNVVPHRQDQCCDVCDSDITDHFMQSILSNIQKLKKQPVYASDSSASSTESISNVNV